MDDQHVKAGERLLRGKPVEVEYPDDLTKGDSPIDLAGDVAIAGMDPLRFLECEDPVEVMVTLAIVRRWFKRRMELDRNLAVEIINKLGKSMKGGVGAG